MSAGRDKNDTLLSVGDVVDIRGVVEMVDKLTGYVSVRLGVTPTARGTGTANPNPDTGTVLRVNLGDVLKVP